MNFTHKKTSEMAPLITCVIDHLEELLDAKHIETPTVRVLADHAQQHCVMTVSFCVASVSPKDATQNALASRIQKDVESVLGGQNAQVKSHLYGNDLAGYFGTMTIYWDEPAPPTTA